MASYLSTLGLLDGWDVTITANLNSEGRHLGECSSEPWYYSQGGHVPRLQRLAIRPIHARAA